MNGPDNGQKRVNPSHIQDGVYIIYILAVWIRQYNARCSITVNASRDDRNEVMSIASRDRVGSKRSYRILSSFVILYPLL